MIAIASLALWTACGSCGSCGEDDREVPVAEPEPEAGPSAEPVYAVPELATAAAPPSPDRSIGSGTRPLYPTPVRMTLADGVARLDPPLRATSVRPIERRPLAAISGIAAAGPVIELVDVDRGEVRWRNESCAAPAVHTTEDRIICAGWQGVKGLSVDDGSELWSSPVMFRAAHLRYVLGRDSEDPMLASVIDSQTGDTVAELIAPPDDGFDDAHAICPTDRGFDVYTWNDAGDLRKLSFGRSRGAPATGRRAWRRRLPMAPAKHELCGSPALVEVPIPGSSERTLHALSPRSGNDQARPLKVRGWWLAPDGGGIETSTADGIQKRSRQLEDEGVLVDGVALGRLVARRGALRLVRAMTGTLALVDDDGLRAWLGAPARVDRAVLAETRLLAGSWLSPPQSNADTALLYELPRERSAGAPPEAARGPTSIPEPKPQKVPPRPPGEPAIYRKRDAGTHAVSRFAIRGDRLYAVALEGRPSAKRGAGVAAFDLAARRWQWHATDACAPRAGVTGLAVADAVVVCAASEVHPGPGHLWAVDRSTGESRWKLELPTVDAVDAAGSAVVASYGPRALVVDATSGERLFELLSDNGHLPRITPVVAGDQTLVVAVETGGLLVARRAVAGGEVVWAARVNGYIYRLTPTATGVAVLMSTGELLLLDAATGEAKALPERSTMWELPPRSDRIVDTPVGTEGVSVLRAFGLGAGEQFRASLAITPPLRLSDNRGPGAPLVFLSHRGDGRIITVDPDSGRVTASYHDPPQMVPGAVFSAIVGGRPIVGALLARPLAVALF
jgi:outer membrane protein assembly factor BamB